jgi:hypothetical protein
VRRETAASILAQRIAGDKTRDLARQLATLVDTHASTLRDQRRVEGELVWLQKKWEMAQQRQLLDRLNSTVNYGSQVGKIGCISGGSH